MRTSSVIGTVVALAVIIGAGCPPQPGKTGGATLPAQVGQKEPGEALSLTLEDYPRVDGSTSTRPLAKLIACKMFDLACHRVVHPFGQLGDRVMAPEATGDRKKAAAAEYVAGRVVHRGTHDSYVHLVMEEADLILVARLPSQDELALAERKEVQLEAKPVALDAFVFIVNTENTIADLTTEQIQGIYTGQIKNWSEVGGQDAQVLAYQRDPNSGSQELMKSLVMKDLEMIDAPDMILHGMEGPIHRVNEERNGLGFSVYYYEQFMAPVRNIKLCAVDGIMPSAKTIRARAYPYTTEVYVVIRQDLPEDSSAYKLREWLLADEGQQIVAESGYVPIR